MAVLQKTLNEHVNLESVRSYADKLKAQVRPIEGYNWPDDPTPKQAAAIEALRAAHDAMRAAIDQAQTAEQQASEVAYDWIYNRA